MQTKIQVVDINKNEAPCAKCGANLIDISNFVYDGKSNARPTYIEELCKCRKCNTQFIMHYDIFDSEGHIYSKIFTEDINNEEYSWQDALTEEQKKKVSEHLKYCNECLDRLSQEMLTDAWLKSFITHLRKCQDSSNK